MATQQTAATQSVDASGVRYAYRTLGPSFSTPFVIHIHFRAAMDFRGPALINALAARRPVIIFDNAGVGKSSGEIPPTYQGWADNVITFVEALGIKQIDLLGFSMGRCCVQMVALTAPWLVLKLILAGTRASQGPTMDTNCMHPEPLAFLSSSNTPEDIEKSIAESFYYRTDEGRAAAKASWERINERAHDRSPFLDLEGAKQQSGAERLAYGNPNNSYDRLGELKMTVLVANSDNDLLVSPYHSWILMDRIKKLAGHGFLYQYAELFASHIHIFLNSQIIEESERGPKL